jgi:hypothetical protein
VDIPLELVWRNVVCCLKVVQWEVHTESMFLERFWVFCKHRELGEPDVVLIFTPLY